MRLIIPSQMLLFAVLTIATSMLIAVFIFIPTKITPAEDAIILFQYSENLAATGRISYFPGGEKAEGATDFLWMVILALAAYMGINTFLASQILSSLAVIFSAVLLYRLAKHTSLIFFPLYLLLLIILPTTPSAVLGFSTHFFGFFVTLSLYYSFNNKPKLFFITGTITCLIRPDGIVFIVPLLLAFFLRNDCNKKVHIPDLLYFFFLPLFTYFISRLWYFGNVFPLPFYVKSSFEPFFLLFNKESLTINIYYLLRLSPFMLFLFIPLMKKRYMLHSVCLLFCIIIPFIFYSSMNLTQNVCERFQHPFIILCLALCAYSSSKDARKIKYYFAALIVSLLLLMPRSINNFCSLNEIPTEQFTAIGKKLHAIDPPGTLAVTEAGRLSYFSKWKTIDLWGLNTPVLTRKLISPDFIEQCRPDIIVVHAEKEDYSFVQHQQHYRHFPYTARTWQHMCSNVWAGINQQIYTILMVPYRHACQETSLIPCCCSAKKSLQAIKSLLIKSNNRQCCFMRYDLFAVNKLSTHFTEITKNLSEHGGISYHTYITLKDLYYTSGECDSNCLL